MRMFVKVMMYLLWVLTIAFILAATFNDFQYEDLNLFALVFLVFSLINSFFIIFQDRKK
ncbi:MAG TPA: hypothetical protein P5246_04920 [Candidatus Omnitrophota bacterium]|jgi:hypothetical protein|nr:hypothetical protein [Candidatus Omnitrophota bacterium]HSA31364.1 hypothetical protein [Candidatus Omnitrophota bacterium]